MSGIAYETYHLGLRTTRRFIRVPANLISILFFPLIQLLVFSQLYQDIVQLPGFGGQSSYLAYLAPGQVAFTAFMAVAWSGYGLLVEYRNGYIDKLRASPIRRWSILAAEMVPLFFQAAIMSAIVLLVSVALGASIATGVGGFFLIVALAGIFGVALAGASFIPALLTKSEQATSTFALLLFPLMFASTAFVPEALMPGWLRVVNDWNPISYLIEAIRSLMVTGYDWQAIGTALVSIGIIGVILQVATLWAFHRLAR
ncbi:MAG TPA: ABC transporter permease [Actinomycetes bacterium]|jgi:ABC-2 type transport system permease protein|nr:ABC transporter permease [Actinomycetes bacterium]HJY25146.1 ABC transporter permease [Actinomycetes bacterium]